MGCFFVCLYGYNNTYERIRPCFKLKSYMIDYKVNWMVWLITMYYYPSVLSNNHKWLMIWKYKNIDNNEYYYI